jgi:hypothetical protein
VVALTVAGGGAWAVTQRQLRLAVAAIVAVPLLAYPLASLAGGAPSFPAREDCARPPTGAPDEQVEVVYARLDDPVAAEALLAELTRTGFVGAGIDLDDCGRWKVSYDAIASLEQGEALAEQVRAAGFDARVEREP